MTDQGPPDQGPPDARPESQLAPKRPMSDARIGGLVATVALIAMFAFVLVLVLTAG